MIENVKQFLGAVARSDLGKAARRSARTVWKAHRTAFEATRQEAGKVLGLAIDEGQKLDARRRKSMNGVVENLAGAADERLSSLEQAFQKQMTRAIRRIGLPTAGEIEALSRRVDALSARVKVRSTNKSPRRVTRRAA
ncbi:MAG: phasin family protein [Steroidobacteraceae bacterium]